MNLKILLPIIFLIALIFIHPIMFLNDEWITVNQLNQLSHGSQILFNEGKYGTFSNGTPYKYFEIRKNILPYTSYLPLFSTPMLWIVKFSDGNIPYFFIIIWFSLAFLVFLKWNENNHEVKKSIQPCLMTEEEFSLVGKNCFNNLNKKNISREKFREFLSSVTFKVTTRKKLLVLSSIFIFLFLNILCYSQIATTNNTDSVEILAVILYHILILAAYFQLIFSINKLLFIQPNRVIFSSVTCICCSSSIFWTNTAKDHLDIMFFFGLLIYSILLHIKTKDPWFGITTFIISGLLTWIRPEYGSFIFLGLCTTYLPLMGMQLDIHKNLKSILIILLSPFSYLIGLIPLFINNYIVMGNVLKMPWQTISGYEIITESNASLNYFGISDQNIFETGLHTLINIIFVFIQRMTPGENLFNGLFSVLLFQESLKLPIFALTPIFFLSMLILPILIIYIKPKIQLIEIQIIFILGSLSVTTILAYLTSIGNLGNSVGIYPDVRYLSPLYLPLSLIGLIILLKFKISSFCLQKMVKRIAIFTLIGIFIIIGITARSYPYFDYSDFFLWINVIIGSLIFSILGILTILFYFEIIVLKTNKIIYLLLPILIVLPLLWQLSQLIIINYSCNLFDQYPCLLPAIKAFFEYILSNTC